MKRSRNREFTRVTYLFILLFLGMMAYIVYFYVFRSQDIISSPYNPRLDIYASRVIRGDILDRNGNVLATTRVGEDGTETREYPYGEVFAHVIGYADKGMSGLESQESFQLLTSHAFFLEQLANEFRDLKNRGDTVVTTLDAELQSAAYNALGNNRGAVFVMEASTGKILAMVSKPGFNPNRISLDWDALNADTEGSPLLNRATQGAYAPGSTFKIVTALAYMRQNTEYGSYTYNCTGSITADQATIHCYNGTVHGAEDLLTSVANSCNTSFANIGLSLDPEGYRDTAQDLLFNRDLPSVLPYYEGQFRVNASTTEAELMMTAMGQGQTQVSPYHMALITAAIANGGTLMEPYLVERITNYSGAQVEAYTPKAYGRLMTSQEAAQLKTYMQAVVTQGTATALSGEAYTVAGKTGTAEYSDADERSHSWFMGFTNVENPELVISVVIEGQGTSAAPSALPVVKQILNSYYY